MNKHESADGVDSTVNNSEMLAAAESREVKDKSINRREFLLKSFLATIGTGLALKSGIARTIGGNGGTEKSKILESTKTVDLGVNKVNIPEIPAELQAKINTPAVQAMWKNVQNGETIEGSDHIKYAHQEYAQIKRFEDNIETDKGINAKTQSAIDNSLDAINSANKLARSYIEKGGASQADRDDLVSQLKITEENISNLLNDPEYFNSPAILTVLAGLDKILSQMQYNVYNLSADGTMTFSINGDFDNEAAVFALLAQDAAKLRNKWVDILSERKRQEQDLTRYQTNTLPRAKKRVALVPVKGIDTAGI